MKASISRTFRDYLSLVKPGIIRGNLLTAVAGFFLASPDSVAVHQLLGLVIGLGLVIAAACVFNNCLDRHIDRQMERTKDRPLAAGRINVQTAVIFGSVLLVAGLQIIIRFTNVLSLALAVAGLIAYVVIYGIGKRTTAQGTLIGSISGAIPPVVGYAAAANRLDSAAFILFLMLLFWQMPHFYGIALYRMKDYKAAKIPVMPLAKGMQYTKYEAVAYMGAYVLAAIALTWLGYTGYIYLLLSSLLGGYWLYVAVRAFKHSDSTRWGKTVFLTSLVVITLQSLLVAVGPRLP